MRDIYIQDSVEFSGAFDDFTEKMFIPKYNHWPTAIPIAFWC